MVDQNPDSGPERILVGICTRRRTKQLVTCAKSIAATIGTGLGLFVAVDDDIVSYDAIPNWPWSQKKLLYPRHYYVRAKMRLYEWCREYALEHGIKYFVHSADDSEWHLPQWGVGAIQKLEEIFPNGEGILELFWPGQCANYITKFSFIDNYLGGNLGDLAYTMYFSNTDLRNRARAISRYVAVSDMEPGSTIVSHQLDVNMDDTALEMQRTWFKLDEKVHTLKWGDDDWA
jgi:hypothetical protein